jgi:hypothetical protein
MPPVLHQVADRLGASAAWLCAIHCALWPLVLALAPAFGAWMWTGWEEAFVVFAAVLGLGSLAVGYRRHRVFRAFWFLLPGLALLIVATVTEIHEHLVWHAVMMTAGGLLVGIAHLVNLRLCHGHVHDASCGHLPQPAADSDPEHAPATISALRT